MQPLTADTARIIDGRFEIEALAGRGGMGLVYRARDLQNGGLVALKEMLTDDADAKSRFLREAEVLARMHHPGIVRHIAHGALASGHPYLAMEWLAGEDLADRLARGPLAVADALTLAAAIADALAFAHGHRVVHRDLKPSNVFLAGGDLGAMKLLDFGVARVQEASASATRTGTVIGTPAYMAPEQARGDRGLDARADLFSLGCLLFECLIGQPPFVGEHAIAVLIKVLIEEPPRLRMLRSEVPVVVEELVQRLLAKPPDQRPANAATVARALREALLELGSGGSAVPRRAPALTANERRIVTLLVVSDPWPGQATHGPVTIDSGDMATALLLPKDEAATVIAGAPSEQTLAENTETVRFLGGGALVDLEQRLSRHGARLNRLVDGTLVATLADAAQATDQASRAAHCALTLHDVLPESVIAVATGYGLALGSGQADVGEAIERAVRKMAQLRDAAVPSEGRIALDDCTARLLGDRFDLMRAADWHADPAFGWTLRGPGQAKSPTAGPGGQLLGRATPLVGRERELRLLQAVFDGCVAEEASGAVLITGAAGGGKTRLVNEWLGQLRARGERFERWSARGDALAADSPFALLAEMLRDAMDLPPNGDAAEHRSRVRTRVARHVAPGSVDHTAEFLSALAGIDDDAQASETLRAARQDPALMATQMVRAVTTWLRGEASEQPLLLVLDDLHWSDAASLRFVFEVLRAMPDKPVLFVGLARPELHERFKTFRELFNSVGVGQEISLGPLAKKASERLVRDVLGAGVADAQVVQIVALADGQVFFLEELIRVAASGQGGSLPPTVLAVAQSRIDTLPPEARQVLRAASIFGHRSSTEGIAALLGEAALDLPTVVDSLIRAEVLVRADGSGPGRGEALSFRQTLVREAAYAMLTQADRMLGHCLAGHWLEGSGERDAAVLALHFERGDAPLHAVRHLATAAEQAVMNSQLEEAAALVERAMRCGATGDDRARLLQVRAELLLWQGKTPAAMPLLREVMAAAAPGSRQWYRCVGEMASGLLRTSDVRGLRALAAELLATTPAANALDALVFCAAKYTVNLLLAGVTEPAAAVLALAEATVAQVDAQPTAEASHAGIGQGARARLWGARATQRARVGDLEGALAAAEQARDNFTAIGDLRNATAQQLDMGQTLFRLGENARAVALISACVRHARSIGLTSMAAFASIAWGAALVIGGRGAEAVPILLEAAAVMRAQELLLPLSWCAKFLADAYLQQGELEPAETHAREAVAAADHVALSQARCHASLARVLLAKDAGRGGPAADEALAEALLARDMLLGDNHRDEEELAVRLTWVKALLAKGNLAAARTATAEVQRRLQERAHAIADATLRAQFLAMAENREIAALA